MPDQPKLLSAILNIRNSRVAQRITDSIEQPGSFTHVSDADPSHIASKGIALLCLTVENEMPPVLYLSFLVKNNRVATGQVRVKGVRTVELDGLTTERLLEALPAALHDRFQNYLQEDYRQFSPKFGEQVYETLLVLKPELAADFEDLFGFLDRKPGDGPTAREQDAAVEKDALGLTLDIFGIDRNDVYRSWRAKGGDLGHSFLSGLTEFAVYEDDALAKDLHTFPGFSAVPKHNITGVVEFESEDGERLTVINANRKPQEKAMGIDLIYFHRRYCLQRLRNFIEEEIPNPSLRDYRLSPSTLFFKLCKKIELKRNDHSLAAGMYISLEQWEHLLNDGSTIGKKGGRQFGYHTLKKRYLHKETFVDLVRSGLIGTSGDATTKIAAFIEDSIKHGHSVMYAIDERLGEPLSRKQNIRRRIEDDILGNPEADFDIEDDDLPF